MILELEPWAIWVIVAIVCLLLEMLIPAFITGGFAVSSFAAAAASVWLGVGLVGQILIFSTMGVLVILPTRRFALKSAPGLKTGYETLVGKCGICLEIIDGDLNPGVVQLDGTRWSAYTKPGIYIEPGQAVEVMSVEGIRLLVHPR